MPFYFIIIHIILLFINYEDVFIKAGDDEIRKGLA